MSSIITKSYFTLPETKIVPAPPEDTDTVIIGVYKNELRQSKDINKISEKIKDIFYICEKANFDGDSGKFLYILNKPIIVLVGLGDRKESDIFWSRENIRRASALGCTEARKLGAESVTLCGFEEKVREALEGAFIGLYRFKKYSKHEHEREKEVKKLFLVSDKNSEKIAEFVRIVCEAQNFARDIINEPGNVINPSTLAEIGSAIAQEYGLFCEIFGVEEMKKMGMHGVLAVGQGSAVPPKFVHIWYKPEEIKSSIKIALIGKAITFDSGGLSIKTNQNMQHMKADKSGACAILAAMKAIAQIKPNIQVHGIYATCENMPSGTAQRVDDIIKMMNGKTVEVVNTDAEGRLTLADAISFANKLGVSKILDMATLTGACMVALGEFTAGIMGNSDEFKRLIFETGLEVGDKMWILPFDKDMEEKIKSPVADLKNAGDSYGGAITAGMFLSKFVEKGIDWCHIDIAGPAFVKKKIGCYTVEGATGFGVRTAVELVKKIQIQNQ